MICGTAFRLVLPDEPGEEDEAPFELYTLDPRDTFVVYSNEIGNKPLMAVKYSKDDNEIFHYSIYTENRYYLVDGDILVESKPHALDMIPIIEYPGNNARLGSFEIVLPLLDAINNVESNRMDGMEQLVQAFIKFINCDITKEEYWTIGGVNYRIAAFDYYLNSGDTNCTTHHVVIVPDTCLYNAQMHNTSSGGWESGAANTTAGGYVGSDMYKSNLEQAKTTIKSAFSGHVLKHRIYLTNAVANGRASDGAWCDSEVDLMCEQMVYGSGIFSPVSDGSNVPANYRVEKSQLPLFQHEPSRICNRATWWLRDVITASYFALVDDNGLADYGSASNSRGVRPAFCIS